MGGKSKRSKRSSRNMGNILTTRNFTIKNVTGTKKHTKTRIQRRINPSGHGVRVTNSYMNKKGIVRHTRTKNVYPYAAASLATQD
jgi:hypothetical protein